MRLRYACSDDADVVVPASAERAVERERVVDARGVLHVDADERAAGRRVLHEGVEQLVAQLEVELQAEPGELDGDIRVEAALVDRGERIGVGGGDRPRLLGRVDLLPEHVDRGALAIGVERRDDSDRVGQRRPGDVRRGDALHDCPGNDWEDGGEGAVEEAHGAADLRLRA